MSHSRAPGRAALAVVSTVAWAAAWPVNAAAQARTVITPSLAVGAAYDDNVLWQPAAESDHVWRLMPGVTFTRDTETSAWLGSADVQSEWYTRFRDLSTPAARQHADLTGKWTRSSRSSIAVASGYDNSISPADLNLTTGIAPGRLRAWRWFTGPEARLSVASHTTLIGRYEVIGEFAAATPGVFTHDGEAGVAQQLDARDEVRVRYVGQVFDFQQFGTIVSNTALVGWTRRMTPAFEFRVDAGARRAASRTRPEIDAAIARHTTFTDGTFNYAWTQTTALGVAELIDVQRLYAAWHYTHPGHLSASAQGGLYRNAFAAGQADIYSGSVEVVLPLFGAFSLAAAYESDYQRGRVGQIVTMPAVGLVSALVPLPILTDQRVRRDVTLIRLIVAGSIRSASGPELPRTDRMSPSGSAQ